MAHTNDRAGVANPLTLADVGGSYLKAAVLKASGKMSTDPVRVKTPKPAMPDAVVAALIESHNGSASLSGLDRLPGCGAGGFRFDGSQSRYQRVAWLALSRW